MNSGQKKILIGIIAYTILWNSQYAWEYLPGLFDMVIILSLMISIVVLVFVGFYQSFKYVLEEQKVKFRLINIGLIILISILTYFKPHGLIDFKIVEGENVLYAMREGAINCTTSIRLKDKNRFKKTSICFRIDHSWGDYELVNDTIKFLYDDDLLNQNDFAIIQLDSLNLSKKLGFILYHSEVGRKDGIPMVIQEVQIDKLKKNK